MMAKMKVRFKFRFKELKRLSSWKMWQAKSRSGSNSGSRSGSGLGLERNLAAERKELGQIMVVVVVVGCRYCGTLQ